MKVVGRIVSAVAVTALLAGSALAQKGPARYGETDKDKTPTEKAAEKDAERAYQRSLGNIPEQKSVDPWGIARDGGAKADATKSDKPAKPKAKSADTKTGNSVK